MNSLDSQERPLIAVLESGDELITTALRSTERLDHHIEHQATILGNDLEYADVLGKSVSFCYQPTHTSSRVKVRYFHGYCTAFCDLGELQSHDTHQYQITVSGWSWFLTKRTNCRIFQRLNTSDIIRKICQEHGFQGQLSIKGSGQKHEYSVQFNESDWDYICRLIAAEGWFYFFDQQEKQHQLIIADSNRTFSDSGEDDVDYFVDSSRLDNALTQWQPNFTLPPVSVLTADYNVELAKPVVADKATGKQSLSRQKPLTQYFYPGSFDDKSQGKVITSNTITGRETEFNRVYGQGSLPKFSAGKTFKLAHHPDPSQQQTYYLQQVEHVLHTGEDGFSLEYQNHFHCLPLSIDWKPALLPKKPIIPALQSATVTGPSNEELHTDQYHRVKVQFHWDREGNNNEDSSCWIRVAQSVAGNGFGGQFTPRIGDEVLVSFLDNDPDRPIIIGSVYNGQQTEPYQTPSQQGIKLQSTPKAGADNFNELRFECKKDSELIYLQAEKDIESLIKNDKTTTIKGNKKTEIEKSAERSVKENDQHTIEGSQKVSVSKDIELKTDANYQITTAKNASQKTDGDYELKVQGKTSVDSTGDLTQSSKSNIKASATNDISLDATSIKASGKSAIELSVGASKVSLSPSAIELSCAGSTVKLSASGVEISGLQVKVDGKISSEIKGGVSATLEGSVKTDVKGTMVTVNGNAMTSVKAGAMVEIQGAIAKIN